jgi:hypothetical protein
MKLFVSGDLELKILFEGAEAIQQFLYVSSYSEKAMRTDSSASLWVLYSQALKALWWIAEVTRASMEERRKIP